MAGRFWRESASLILASTSKRLRKLGVPKKVPDSDSEYSVTDYEILMGLRSSKSSFMSGASVFPGGVISSFDSDPSWIDEVFSRSSFDIQDVILPQTIPRALCLKTRDEDAGRLPRDVSFRLAAIRETFEETGVLLTTSNNSNISQSELNEWRHKIHSDPKKFIFMCNHFEIVPDIWSLYEWSAWLTPLGLPGKGQRFDTIFYAAFLSEEKDFGLPASEDSKEISKVFWDEPFGILNSYYKNDYWLAPPQVYELGRLINFKKMSKLEKFAKKRQNKGSESIFPVLARIQNSDGFFSLLPGDDYYPENPILEVDQEDYEENFVDHTFKDAIKYTHKQNRLFMPRDNKFLTIPFVNIEDSYGHYSPVQIVKPKSYL